MSVEFLGAIYNGCTETKEKKHFYCKRFTHPPKGPSKCAGYSLFYSEMGPQILKSRVIRKGTNLNRLVGAAWKELSGDQKEDYNRRAKENGPVKPMKERCPGKLVFVKQAGMSVNGLMSFVPHSEELSVLNHDS